MASRRLRVTVHSAENLEDVAHRYESGTPMVMHSWVRLPSGETQGVLEFSYMFGEQFTVATPAGYPPNAGPSYPPQGHGYPPPGHQRPTWPPSYPPQGHGYPPPGHQWPTRTPSYPPQGHGYPPPGHQRPTPVELASAASAGLSLGSKIADLFNAG